MENEMDPANYLGSVEGMENQTEGKVEYEMQTAFT